MVKTLLLLSVLLLDQNQPQANQANSAARHKLFAVDSSTNKLVCFANEEELHPVIIKVLLDTNIHWQHNHNNKRLTVEDLRELNVNGTEIYLTVSLEEIIITK